MRAGLLASIVSAAVVSVSWAQAPANPALPPGTAAEQGEAEILKVYSFEDQGAKFRAYGIKHKGNDVIVSDELARTDKKVGEKIDYVAMRINNVIMFKVWGFGVVPKKK
jgi:hypothetical protein